MKETRTFVSNPAHEDKLCAHGGASSQKKTHPYHDRPAILLALIVSVPCIVLESEIPVVILPPCRLDERVAYWRDEQ
jgi:hypothetical protein